MQQLRVWGRQVIFAQQFMPLCADCVRCAARNFKGVCTREWFVCACACVYAWLCRLFPQLCRRMRLPPTHSSKHRGNSALHDVCLCGMGVSELDACAMD